MTLSPELLVVVVGGIIEILIFLFGLPLAINRLSLERKAVTAEAENDTANSKKALVDAGSSWLETYNKMFVLMQQRDTEIIALNRRVAQLEDSNRATLTELEAERKLRIEAEARATRAEESLKAMRSELEAQIAELRTEVTRLRSQQPTVTVLPVTPIPSSVVP